VAAPRTWKLLPVAEARRIALTASFSEPPREAIPSHLAAWRIAAEDVVADRDVPAEPLAAMDGYAVRSVDLERLGRLRVAGRVSRGSEPPELGEGEAYEVETGAPLPRGADAVVRREASRVENGMLSTAERAWPGKDVFPPGEFVSKGDLLVRRGEVITPYRLSLILQAGVPEVEVYRVRATIIVAGDASQPGTPPARGRPWDNVSPMIASLMPWAETRVYWPPCGRGEEWVEEAIDEASRVSDIVVTVGGASVGSGDTVKEAVARLGELLVPGVAVNVAKRGGLGRVRGRMVAILPGQCVSAVTAFHEIALRAMRGVTGESLARSERARLAGDVRVERRMDTLYLVRLSAGWAEPLEWGVALCRELARAHGYVILPRGYHPRGAEVEVTLLHGSQLQ
jgi:molybdopterin molybdotransferase